MHSIEVEKVVVFAGINLGRILLFAPGGKMISEVTTSLQTQAAKLGLVQSKAPTNS